MQSCDLQMVNRQGAGGGREASLVLKAMQQAEESFANGINSFSTHSGVCVEIRITNCPPVFSFASQSKRYLGAAMNHLSKVYPASLKSHFPSTGRERVYI